MNDVTTSGVKVTEFDPTWPAAIRYILLVKQCKRIWITPCYGFVVASFTLVTVLGQEVTEPRDLIEVPVNALDKVPCDPIPFAGAYEVCVVVIALDFCVEAFVD